MIYLFKSPVIREHHHSHQYVTKFIFNKIQAYFEDTNEELYNIKDRRDGDILLRSYKSGRINLCWRKLDRKSKKLSFNINVADQASNSIASTDTLDLLKQDLATLQSKLDMMSRNVYIQQDIEKEHFECNQYIDLL